MLVELIQSTVTTYNRGTLGHQFDPCKLWENLSKGHCSMRSSCLLI